MNLLLVGNHFSEKKYNLNAWQDFATHMRAAGNTVITTSNKENKVLRMIDMLVTIWNRRKEYQVAQVDVFSGQAFIWSYLSTKLLAALRKPIILTMHGGNLPEYSSRHSSSVKWLLNAADAVTAPSPYLFSKMSQYRKDITLIPNAIDIDLYPFIQRKTVEPSLIWLRAFHQIYNPEMAIKVVDIIKKSMPEVRLLMIGPDKGDKSFQRVQRLVSRLNLENQVCFPGKCLKSEVPYWLNQGDIFINTTNFDNTPVSVLEALACGLCVVSTNVGGIPHLLKDGENALLVPPDDVSKMAEAVLRILNENGLAHKLSNNARSYAENCDWKIVIQKWQKLFNEIQ